MTTEIIKQFKIKGHTMHFDLIGTLIGVSIAAIGGYLQWYAWKNWA